MSSLSDGVPLLSVPPRFPLAARAAKLAWDLVVRQWPATAVDMLRQAGAYTIFGTGFSKVSIGYDNPTAAHYDSNYGVDVVVAFDVGDLSVERLRGGVHVMTSDDASVGVAVETSRLGVCIAGSHAHLLHANTATTSGGRLVFAFYLSEALLKDAPNRMRPATRAMSVCE